MNTIIIPDYPISGTTWFTNLSKYHPDIVCWQKFIRHCYKHYPQGLFQQLKYNFEAGQIPGIEKHRLDIFAKLLEFPIH